MLKRIGIQRLVSVPTRQRKAEQDREAFSGSVYNAFRVYITVFPHYYFVAYLTPT